MFPTPQVGSLFPLLKESLGTRLQRGYCLGVTAIFGGHHLIRAVCFSPCSTGVHSALCGDVGVAAADEY